MIMTQIMTRSEVIRLKMLNKVIMKILLVTIFEVRYFLHDP